MQLKINILHLRTWNKFQWQKNTSDHAYILFSTVPLPPLWQPGNIFVMWCIYFHLCKYLSQNNLTRWPQLMMNQQHKFSLLSQDVTKNISMFLMLIKEKENFKFYYNKQTVHLIMFLWKRDWDTANDFAVKIILLLKLKESRNY